MLSIQVKGEFHEVQGEEEGVEVVIAGKIHSGLPFQSTNQTVPLTLNPNSEVGLILSLTTSLEEQISNCVNPPVFYSVSIIFS